MSVKEKIERIKLVKELNKKQKIVDKLYEEQGLTEEILNLQLEINQKRHEANITDHKEVIYKNYVQ